MTNSIWRKASEKPDIDKQILIINDLGYIIYFGKCAVAPGNKWAYIDDLISQADKAEQLQKAVDLALDALEYADKALTGGTVGWETHIQKAIKEIKQLTQGNK